MQTSSLGRYTVQYKNVIMGATRSEVDQVKVCSSLWCNVALPGLLYAADVVPFPGSVIRDINLIQTQLGKAILKLPKSTANPVVHVELGWQPIQLLIAAAKLRFLKRVSSPSFLVASCMTWNKENQGTLYMKNLEEVLSPYLNRPEDDVASLTVQDLRLHHEVFKALSRIWCH